VAVVDHGAFGARSKSAVLITCRASACSIQRTGIAFRMTQSPKGVLDSAIARSNGEYSRLRAGGV
jgi:hypothetical protein